MTSTTGSGSGEGFIQQLGWRTERRPEPGFAHVLAAGAGAFLVFAMVALVIKITSDDATLPGVAGSLILLVAAVVAGMKGPGPVRSAAVTVAVLCVPLLWGFTFIGNGDASDGSQRGIYILSTFSYLGFFAIAWTRGRAIFLGLALLVGFSWIVSEVQGDDAGLVPFQTTFETNSPFDTGPAFEEDDSSLSDGDGTSFSFEDEDDNSTEASAVAFALGILALGAGYTLDRRKQAGLATPFIAVGALFGIAGGITLGASESVIWGGVLAAISGAITGFVGGLGLHRRGSTWIGVLAIVGGFAAIVIDIAEDELGFAGLFALVAILLGAAALYLAPRLKEAPDGDEEAASATTT